LQQGRQWDPAVLVLGVNDFTGGYGQGEDGGGISPPCPGCKRSSRKGLAALLFTTLPALAVASRAVGMDMDVDALVVVFVFQLAGIGTVVVVYAERSADGISPSWPMRWC